MEFERELDRVLPPDLPHRDCVIGKTATHLQLVASANELMNLTRIVSPLEAAVKHVCDSVLPWRHFQEGKHILDAGTGAGFPGIPLSVVLPEVRFTLAESIQKKARFVDSVVEHLELPNVQVHPERAEQVACTSSPDIITARAVAPISRLLDLFRKPLKAGKRLILYKGPDVEAELAEAKSHKLDARILCRYELPEHFGTRTLLELKLSSVEPAKPRRQAAANRQ